MSMTRKAPSKLGNGYMIERSRNVPVFLRAWLDHDLSIAREVGTALAVYDIRIDDDEGLTKESADGDWEQALKRLRSRWVAELGSAASLIRSAKDSFTIIQSFSGEPLVLHETATRLLKSLQQGTDHQAMLVSIGIASYPEDGHQADQLLERAHQALSRADRWAGNGFCFYSRVTSARIADLLERQESLRRDLHTDNLTLRFQPIFDLVQGGVHVVSGELAWSHEKFGCITLNEAAVIAERVDILPQFNEWLIDSLARQLVSWRNAGIQRAISVALTRAQIEDGKFAGAVRRCFSRRGLTSDMLEILVDHGLLMNETDHRLHMGLHQLADLGVALAISNVGDGPLALNSIQRLPFDRLSLSANLIAAVDRCSKSETMLRAVIRLGHELDLTMRAVDVSSYEQEKALRKLECDEGMGPIYAPALKGADLDLLTTLRPRLSQHRELELISQPLSMH